MKHKLELPDGTIEAVRLFLETGPFGKTILSVEDKHGTHEGVLSITKQGTLIRWVGLSIRGFQTTRKRRRIKREED